MSTFNTKRFANYANFDLTINKNFYRNLALVLFFTIVGIVVLSFFMRWLTYQMSAPSGIYNDLTLTSLVVIVIMQFSLYIAGGCTLHPLRNKQGRITNLTMPATNLEKYTWHVLVCVIGAIVVSVVSVAVADLINYLMTIAVFKSGEGVQSLFVSVFSNTTGTAIQNFTNQMHASMNGVTITDSTYVSPQDMVLGNILDASLFATWAGIFCTTSIYAFGNSLKYKFNLPITYIILKAIEFLFAIILFVGMIWFTANIDTMDRMFAEETMRAFFENFHIYLYVWGSLSILAGIGFFVWAYNRYTKAQLCNKLNR
ncbi:MAG: hypothetical protein J5770_00635 [Bacteroidaceae bacterium]|nr:hypothetical protein [Bacteroidaceae bacterium]